MLERGVFPHHPHPTSPHSPAPAGEGHRNGAAERIKHNVANERESLDETQNTPASQLNDDQTKDLLKFANVERNHNPVPIKHHNNNNQIIQTDQTASFN